MRLPRLFKRNPAPSAPPQRKRNYAAAATMARYGDFIGSSGSADYELAMSLTKLRSKARYLARNSASMVRYMQLMRENVVGDEGFRFQCRMTKDTGDGKHTLDTNLNARVEDAWREWCEAPTTCGTMTMVDLQEQAVDTYARDGEVIWEIVTGSRWKHGIAINPIESDYLDEQLNSTADSGNEIRMGVEINSDNAPVAYWFLTRHPGDTTWAGTVGSTKRHRRVPADRVLHLFRRTRPGQTRGEPPTASIMNSVKMIDGYREAEVTGRRLAASIMGFFKSMMPKAEGINALADGHDEDRELLEMGVEPGLLKELPPGLDFTPFNPGGLNSDYSQFESQVKKDQAMGYGISAFSHGMETAGVSYSTGRSVIIEDRDHYKSVQKFIIRNLIRPLYRKWLGSVNLTEDAPFPPSKLDRLRKSKSFVFRPRGWDWVDPAKDVKANAEALKTKQTSLARVAAQRGMDRDELLAEIAEDQQAAESFGLTLDYDGAKNIAKKEGANAKQ